MDRLSRGLCPIGDPAHRLWLLRDGAGAVNSADERSRRVPWAQAFLGKYPELAVYLTVAIGYVIGKLRITGIGLGPVTGSLIAGMLVGQFAQVPVSSMAKSFL